MLQSLYQYRLTVCICFQGYNQVKSFFVLMVKLFQLRADIFIRDFGL